MFFCRLALIVSMVMMVTKAHPYIAPGNDSTAAYADLQVFGTALFNLKT
ncbi:unnamed protein product [Gongylonema pulchrum]|uniref:Secreted protein n=1 Tax=Gongylonema pulchrum TaxID=637853 RepID=A0A183ES78_9BILA|nr:unnamed protein product [Gongylonema pulchrum]